VYSILLKNLIIILVFFPAFASGQSATFYADSSRLRNYVGNTSSAVEHAMQMEWRIKDQTLHWGGSILVAPSQSGLDTICFRLRETAIWDTLICKMQANSTIRFVYNSCCDYFDVFDETGDRMEGKVSFDLKGSIPKSKKYLGTIDGNGVLLTSTAQIVSPMYRSPMFPNSYNIAIQEIIKCTGKDCEEAVIQRPDGSIDLSYHYRIVDRILSFHYLPVSEDPIEVLYDIESGKVVVR